MFGTRFKILLIILFSLGAAIYFHYSWISHEGYKLNIRESVCKIAGKGVVLKEDGTYVGYLNIHLEDLSFRRNKLYEVCSMETKIQAEEYLEYNFGNTRLLPCHYNIETGRISILSEDLHELDIINYTRENWAYFFSILTFLSVMGWIIYEVYFAQETFFNGMMYSFLLKRGYFKKEF